MNFKKRVNGSWTDIPHYIHKTDTDTLTTLPDVVYVNDTTATVGLKGNTIQSGTPTPDNPIMPQGTGERTGNLAQWEKGGINVSTGANEAYRTKEQGGTCEQLRTQYIYCIGNHDYVLSTNKYPVQTFISFYDENKNYLARTSGTPQGETRNFRTNVNAKYMRAQLAHAVENQVYPAIEGNAQFAIMLGSTPLPYEPYGYKLDISCGDTITSIYLGEVVTTRKIKKLVLTGEENFVYDSNYTRFRFVMPNSLIIGVRRTPVICTHYEAVTDGRPIEEVINNTIYSDSVRQDRWWIEDERFSSANDFKAYLAEQYAAGTPVTIWYILTEPETAIVNEPLMKIGDYADEITNVSVPTIVGTNTFDVDTTVQPSEVTLNYHGWHPIANIHEHDNGAWN